MGKDGDRDGEDKRAGLSCKQKVKLLLAVGLVLVVVIGCALLWTMGS